MGAVNQFGDGSHSGGRGGRGGGGRSRLVVREVSTVRGSAAERAMLAAGEELGQVLSPAVGQQMWAAQFGLRVLSADDIEGRRHGLVTQHDDIRWADVLQLAVFATPAVEALGHPRAGCSVDPECPACRVVRALGRIRSVWRASGMTLEEVGAALLAPGSAGGPVAEEVRPVPAAALRTVKAPTGSGRGVDRDEAAAWVAAAGRPVPDPSRRGRSGAAGARGG